jgi:hypothetical protein
MFKRTRKLIAMIGLAVAVGASLTPAKALVPTAWARFNEINEMIIKTKTWEKLKAERLQRIGHCKNFGKASCTNRAHHGESCKWQTDDIFHKGEGYCYPAK